MTTRYIDAGVNLTSSQFDDARDDIVMRAKQAGVDNMLLIGTNTQDSMHCLQLARHYGFVCTSGIHPHDAKSTQADYIAQLKTLFLHPEVVAVGECGLDFNRNFSPRSEQISVLSQQLELAEQNNLPVYLHERDAFDAMRAQLEQVKVHGVLHCFTGDKHALDFYLHYGLMIGITGWVCDERRGAQLQQLVPLIPDDRLLIETDAPYLLPRTLKPKPKSRRNEPAFVEAIVREVARLRGQSCEHVAKISHANFQRLFITRRGTQ
ncbi:3'-5' ssDNA/RNA exonuclease TatD [Pseudoalteromonas sp. CIP111854]|uniref:3'-5' ssDNA/RNA exonuclease TatD n=1 Tax=Pseudoalteromonas holothuriae TaxID=2963714 RepID=A0A9W4R4I1_9GAMM|nr:TatD family hydrolase [Pseudoalteromonas sp. CIP111854]CAH9066337.1 3'-5' ssDNA/RNA exonuclease TatD [Pseudoalteromonas sp. CIP111854]